MKRIIALLAVLFSLVNGLRSQVITITFEATLNTAPIALDSIRVMNLTAGGDTMIYFPDNVLVLGSTGIGEALYTDGKMHALPNPFASSTEVAVESLGGAARIALHDVAGRELVSLAANISSGVQRFRVSCARQGVHLLSVVQGGVRHTMRLMATEGAGVDGMSWVNQEQRVRAKSERSLFIWAPGDELRYIGYATSEAVLHSGAIDEVPAISATRTFDLFAGLVCPESPTVTDIDGNVYRTVQIGAQCWMAENLRTSTYSDGWPITHLTENADWIETNTGAWCNYDNDSANDTIYGKLYNWYAAANPSVCPQGWHPASDSDWQQMESTLGMTESELIDAGFRGEAQNVGGQLKTTTMWDPPNSGATNASGFAGPPGGHRYVNNGNFMLEGAYAHWWTTTANIPGTAYFRVLYDSSTGIIRNISNKRQGCYVRCVRD